MTTINNLKYNGGHVPLRSMHDLSSNPVLPMNAYRNISAKIRIIIFLSMRHYNKWQFLQKILLSVFNVLLIFMYTQIHYMILIGLQTYLLSNALPIALNASHVSSPTGAIWEGGRRKPYRPLSGSSIV